MKKIILIKIIVNDEINEDKKYSLALQQFYFNNMDKFLDLNLEEISKNKKPEIEFQICREREIKKLQSDLL